jgi:hypothetical protein
MGLLVLLVLALVGYNFVIGRQVIDGRMTRGAADDGPKEESPSSIACCGFGLPPEEKRKPN